MPVTNDIQLLIDNQQVDLDDTAKSSIRISYALEDPENFEQKQAAITTDISLPATPNNDRIFNTYHNPKVLDLTPDSTFSDWRSFLIRVNGVEIQRGSAILQSASYTRLQEGYSLTIVGQTGDWLMDAKDLTIWDCLSDTPHTFDLATVEGSWQHFDDSETRDFVYAPVRYRQPFQYVDPNPASSSYGQNIGLDDRVTVYHLRPSISIYWILFRAFRLLGYRIKSDFLNTAQYFRHMVLLWTWGDFYDINSQLIESMLFKASGPIPFPPPLGYPDHTGFVGTHVFFAGAALSSTPSLDIDNTGWVPFTYTASSGRPAGIGYVQTLTEVAFGFSLNLYHNFRLNNVSAPNGFDNLTLYSWDDTTGTAQYIFNPPPSLAPYIGTNISLQFSMNLIAQNICQSSPGAVHENLFIEWQINGGALNLELFSELSSTTSGETKGSLLFPTIHNFIIPNVNIGDVIKIRLKYDSSGNLDNHLNILSSGYLNVDPGVLGVSPWQYDFTTQHWNNLSNNNGTNTVWQPMYSSLQLNGFLIQLGNSVNFKFYDKFRSYKLLDLFNGLVDCYNLTVQTDPVNRIVVIEPTNDYVLPDGTQKKGYYNLGMLDWSGKLDVSKLNQNIHFKDAERQFDFSFKNDGSDGGQNLFTARYKGIYLNNLRGTQTNGINNTNNNNGIIAAVPGSSRYMFPRVFPSGNKQQTNRFFSSVMHYKHSPWFNINELTGGSPSDNVTPQLIAIIPENINDSSASAVTQTFEPKMAFYSGKESSLNVGGWRYIGNPATPYVDGGTPNAIGFQLPYMFAVDYTGTAGTSPGTMAPILTYCDQNINGVVKAGLMKTFFLRRLAIMRTGKQCKMWMRLTLGDMTDWLHQNPIIINGDTYHLIAIDNYNPLSDDSCLCTFWKVANPSQVDLDNIYPSSTSILTSPSILPQFDLKYAKLLLYMSDLPQSG